MLLGHTTIFSVSLVALYVLEYLFVPKIVRPQTQLCDLLSLGTPIFQAPMAGAVTPELISAVANYGGLGMVPLSNWSIENCEKFIDETLTLSKRVIGVNLILEWDQTERLELALKKGIKVIWFFWGDPSPFIKKIHEQGAKVILTVGSSEEAKRAVAAGVDVIVAQGWEAGGHVSFILMKFRSFGNFRFIFLYQLQASVANSFFQSFISR